MPGYGGVGKGKKKAENDTWQADEVRYNLVIYVDPDYTDKCTAKKHIPQGRETEAKAEYYSTKEEGSNEFHYRVLQ